MWLVVGLFKILLILLIKFDIYDFFVVILIYYYNVMV